MNSSKAKSPDMLSYPTGGSKAKSRSRKYRKAAILVLLAGRKLETFANLLVTTVINGHGLIPAASRNVTYTDDSPYDS
jgi:hypothetical protein